MEARIKLNRAKYINGVGIVIEFLVLEGVIKPGMKTEFNPKQAIKMALFKQNC